MRACQLYNICSLCLRIIDLENELETRKKLEFRSEKNRKWIWSGTSVGNGRENYINRKWKWNGIGNKKWSTSATVRFRSRLLVEINLLYNLVEINLLLWVLEPISWLTIYSSLNCLLLMIDRNCQMECEQDAKIWLQATTEGQGFFQAVWKQVCRAIVWLGFGGQ